ncbi:MAG: PEGA domain-containing protein [Acidobacteria bacterium]|nr:PEGA domain-containing protein [Acidobacteriota bacterium]
MKPGWLLLFLVVAFAALCQISFAQKDKPPLTKMQIIELLKNDVAPARVQELAKEVGIAFRLTPEAEGALREAGATEGLLKALRQISPAEPTPPPAPLPSTLLIETQPPAGEVYLDDELVGKAGTDGKLRISTLSAGEHSLRVALPGHQDYVGTVELSPGQTLAMAVVLKVAEPEAKSKAASGPAPAATSRQPSDPSPPVLGQFPAIVNESFGLPADDPDAVGFSVVHHHGGGRLRGMPMCLGNLVITKGRVEFNGYPGGHSFDAPLNAVTEVEVQDGRVGMRVRGKQYHFRVDADGDSAEGLEALREALTDAGAKPKK